MRVFFTCIITKYWGLRLVLFGFQDEYAKNGFSFISMQCSIAANMVSIIHRTSYLSRIMSQKEKQHHFCISLNQSPSRTAGLITHTLPSFERNMKVCGGKLSGTCNQAVWARASFFFFFFNLVSQLALLMMCVKRNQTPVPLHPQVMGLKWILWSHVIDGGEFADSMRDHYK